MLTPAVVNLTTERATVDFDPEKTEVKALVNKINRAGYGVLTTIVEFSIPQMSDDNDARRIENELSRKDGIAACTVSFASQKVKVEYIPTIISIPQIEEKIKQIGFKAVEIGVNDRDAEVIARQHEIKHTKKDTW